PSVVPACSRPPGRSPPALRGPRAARRPSAQPISRLRRCAARSPARPSTPAAVSSARASCTVPSPTRTSRTAAASRSRTRKPRRADQRPQARRASHVVDADQVLPHEPPRVTTLGPAASFPDGASFRRSCLRLTPASADRSRAAGGPATALRCPPLAGAEGHGAYLAPTLVGRDAGAGEQLKDGLGGGVEHRAQVVDVLEDFDVSKPGCLERRKVGLPPHRARDTTHVGVDVLLDGRGQRAVEDDVLDDEPPLGPQTRRYSLKRPLPSGGRFTSHISPTPHTPTHRVQAAPPPAPRGTPPGGSRASRRSRAPSGPSPGSCPRRSPGLPCPPASRPGRRRCQRRSRGRAPTLRAAVSGGRRELRSRGPGWRR